MINENAIDIKEEYIARLDPDLLKVLLFDRTSRQNIIWATVHYAERGLGFQPDDYLEIQRITGRNKNVIRPRIVKSKKEQSMRVKSKAEVFTPSWICNSQNNLVDETWFGVKNVFNTEMDKLWKTNPEKIVFPQGKTWQEYVRLKRMEITCGEAPYLVSRYDTVTGNEIEIHDRIGLLDRKLRIVNENTITEEEWYKWAKIAFQSVYGFEYQGDNVLIARENLLFSFSDYYKEKFNKETSKKMLLEISRIISWNIWQMDGLKYIIPLSDIKAVKSEQLALFNNDAIDRNAKDCGGVYCKIFDWGHDHSLLYKNLIKGDEK